MKMSTNQKTLCSLAVLMALSACGGGGGGGGGTSNTSYSGRVVDGYVKDATVFCDANGNLAADAGEMTTTSNAQGIFTFSSACSGTVVAKGGVDTSTGFNFLGVLSAPQGSTVISPLTTLLATSGLSQDKLLVALGLPANTDLTKADPMQDIALLRKNVAVQQVLQRIANFFNTQSTPDDNQYQRAAKFLVKAIESSTTPLFSSTNTVDAAIVGSAVQTMAVEVTGTQLDSDDLNAVVTTLVTESQAYLVASDITAVIDKAKEQLNPAKPPIQTPTVQKNYLALTNNTFHINGLPYTLDQVRSTNGIEIDGIETVQFQYSAVGTVDVDQVVHLGASVEEKGGSGRILQVKVEQLRIQRDHTTRKVTVSTRDDTAIHAYVRDHRGVSVNLTLDASELSDLPTSISGDLDSLTLDYVALVNKIADSARVPSHFDMAEYKRQLLNLNGVFEVKAAVTPNLNVRYHNKNHEPLPTVSMGIYNSAPYHYGVRGYGIEGTVRVNQPR